MAITVRINGVDRTTSVSAKSTTSFTIGLNRRGSARFTITSKTASYEPAIGHQVELFDEGARLFAGTIDSIEKTLILPTGVSLICNCVSLEQRLDKRRLQPRTYVNITAGAIVLDMLSNVAAGEGITAGTISNGVVIDRLPVDETITVAALIDSLAEKSGFIWYVESDTQLHFHSPIAVKIGRAHV